MLNINDQLYVAIKVDGNLLPLGGGQLQDIVISETVNQFLPTIEFKYVDRFGLLFSNPNLYDGKVISVAIATSYKDIESSWKEFIVYPREVYPRLDGFFVSVVGFLNCPEYLLGGNSGSFSGTSSDVAKQIASQCSLTPIVDNSNDNQIWLMANQSRAKFLKSVCNHAFSDSKSAYINFVDRNRNLYFIDVSKRRSKRPKYTFQTTTTMIDQNPPANTILVPETEFTVNFSSDLLNACGGYGIVFRQFDYVQGREVLGTPKDYIPTTKYLNLNPSIDGLRTQYAPPNVGNTHSSYALANAQNFRNRALYSVSMLLTTPVPKIINLFDRVQFSYHDRAVSEAGSVLEGFYFVERIIQTISQGSFMVNYGLIREGINSSGTITDLED